MTTWTLSGFGDEIDPDPVVQLSMLWSSWTGCVGTELEDGLRAVRHQLIAEGERLRQAGADVLDLVLKESLGSPSREDLATLYRLLNVATE